MGGTIIYFPSTNPRSFVYVTRNIVTRNAGGFNYDFGDFRPSVFLAVVGGGGDPHIITMLGEQGDIGNFNGILSLFSSDSLELRANVHNRFFTEVGATIMIEGEPLVFEAKVENNNPVVIVNGELIELGIVRKYFKFIEFLFQDRTTSQL